MIVACANPLEQIFSRREGPLSHRGGPSAILWLTRQMEQGMVKIARSLSGFTVRLDAQSRV